MVFPDGDNTYRVLGAVITLFPKPGELISNIRGVDVAARRIAGERQLRIGHVTSSWRC
jgi:hypothetical protein